MIEPCDFDTCSLEQMDEWLRVNWILRDMANHLREAKRHRLAGNIVLAVRHEVIAERYYNQLPEDQKW